MADRKSLSAFVFEGQGVVRATTGPDGEPWFVGLDVCRTLGIRKHKQALGRLKNDERGAYDVGTPGGLQSMIVVSEPGVFRLIFSSKKPEAERFKDWVYHEVLPSIRRTGGYEQQSRRRGNGRDWTNQINAACRAIDVVRRTQGPRIAVRFAIQIFAEIGHDISGEPEQGELDLRIVGGIDA